MSSLQRKIYGVQPKEELRQGLHGYRPLSADYWDGFVVVAKRMPEAMKLVAEAIKSNAPQQTIDHFDFEVIGYANEKVKSGIILASYYGV